MEYLPAISICGGLGILSLIGFAFWQNGRKVKRIMNLAQDALKSSANSEQIKERLLAEKMRPENVEWILQKARREILLSETAKKVAAGLNANEATQLLISGGVDLETAKATAHDMVHVPWSHIHPRLSVVLGSVLMILGSGVLIASLILRDGNITGKLPTFPYAGMITKLVGMAFFVFGLVMVVIPLRRPAYFDELIAKALHGSTNSASAE